MIDALVIIGSLLEILGVVPYFLSAVKGEAKPNIVSWMTWTLLTLIVSSTAFASSDWRVGTVVLANALGTASIVMLGFWKGYTHMTRFDASCWVVATLGLLSWPLLHTILPAVLVTIAIDAVALLPTLRHAWRRPREEAWATYAMQAAGSLCVLLATSFHSSAALLYPAYLTLADGSVVIIVLARLLLTQQGRLEK